MDLAGSAIAQKAGLMATLETWMPTPTAYLKPKWLLLAGATDPPEDVSISDRRTRDAEGEKSGAFLQGIAKDLANMEAAIVAIKGKLHNSIKNLYMTKEEALKHIAKFFNHCQRGGFKPMLYYTGHGQIGTGNWCFDDGTIGVEEILRLLPGGPGCYYPVLFCDTCYSGNWANFCLEKAIPGLQCLSACPEFTTAMDVPGVLKYDF